MTPSTLLCRRAPGGSTILRQSQVPPTIPHSSAAETRCCAEKQSLLQPRLWYGGTIPGDRLRFLENGSVLIVFHMQLHKSTREEFASCAEGYSAYCTVSSRQCRETLTSVSIPCSGRSDRISLPNAGSTGRTPSPSQRGNGPRPPLPPVGLA